MISMSNIIKIHEETINKHGGIHGIRDISLLESAINSANQTFMGKYLNKTLLERIVKLYYSICKNHAFIDGNKRVAGAVLQLELKTMGYKLKFNSVEFKDFVLDTASGKLNYDKIINIIRSNLVKL